MCWRLEALREQQKISSRPLGICVSIQKRAHRPKTHTTLLSWEWIAGTIDFPLAPRRLAHTCGIPTHAALEIGYSTL